MSIREPRLPTYRRVVYSGTAPLHDSHPGHSFHTLGRDCRARGYALAAMEDSPEMRNFLEVRISARTAVSAPDLCPPACAASHRLSTLCRLAAALYRFSDAQQQTDGSAHQMEKQKAVFNELVVRHVRCRPAP